MKTDNKDIKIGDKFIVQPADYYTWNLEIKDLDKERTKNGEVFWVVEVVGKKLAVVTIEDKV